MNDDWVSADTETKERHFHGIFWTHVTMCKGIIPKHSRLPYLYVDLHAGRGNLEYRGRQFIGSPLIARDILSRAGIRYQAMHYEAQPDQAALLADALWVPTNLVDVADATNHPIHAERCEVGFSRWLDENRHDRFGLVYSDPQKDEIPHELLNKTATAMPHVDLLAYVMATQYLRRRRADEARNGENATRPFLLDHIKAVRKRFTLIREPLGKWKSTFILWTDWEGYPSWEAAKFVRLDSERGQRYLEWVNYTKPEQHRRANTPLWGEDAA